MGDDRKHFIRRVTFSDLITVRQLHHWEYAHRQARKGGYWEQCARDRERFLCRIRRVEVVLVPCLLIQIMLAKKMTLDSSKRLGDNNDNNHESSHQVGF